MNEVSICLFIGIALAVTASVAFISAWIAYNIGVSRGRCEREEEIAEENNIQR